MTEKVSIKLPPGRARKHGGWTYLTTGKLPEHRREVSRYLTAVRRGLIRDLGSTEEDLSAGQLILIDRVVTKLGIIRCMEEHVKETSVMAGNSVAPCLKASYLAYNNSVRLDLQALGLHMGKNEEPADLIDYIQTKDEDKNKAAIIVAEAKA